MVDETLGIVELEDNLADVEKPPELPPGLYTGEVQDVQINDTQKGNRAFAIRFVIAQDEIPVDMQDQFEDGAILYWNRQIVPTSKDRRALFNLRRLVESLGLDANTTTIDPNEWMGCRARLRVRHGTWQGEKRAEIAAVEPAEAEVPQQAREEPAPKGRTARGRAAR